MASKVSGVKGAAIRQIEERFETDRFGVDSIQLKVEIPDAVFPSAVLAPFAAHPDYSTMALARRSGARTRPGIWTVTYFFEGFLFELPDPYYELQGSLDQEPIESHPDFITDIAGKPSAPLNGAVFVDPETGQVTTDDDIGVFREFAATLAGAVNPKGGIEAFWSPGAEWRAMSFTTTRPTTLGDLGKIDSPDGPNPTLSGRNYLRWSEIYTRRGHIYQVTKTWKLSGRNGWDSDIY